MEKRWPDIEDKFYKKNNLRKSGDGPGGKFNGPSIKYILKEASLKQMEEVINDDSVSLHFTNYLRSIRELHSFVTAKELGNFEPVLNTFKSHFYYLYDNYKLNMSLKIHVIIDHYDHCFKSTGLSLKDTNGEFTVRLQQLLEDNAQKQQFS